MPRKEEDIITHLGKAIAAGATDDQCCRYLWDLFGIAGDLQDEIVKMAHMGLQKTPVPLPPSIPSGGPTTEQQVDITEIAEHLDSDIFGPQELDGHEAMFKQKIAPKGFDLLNINLTKKNSRKLTYRDLAIIFAAFKKNVEGNDDGGCPQQSLIAFTQRHEEVEAPYSTLHIKAAIEIFIKPGLAQVEAKHNHFQHKGTRYKLL